MFSNRVEVSSSQLPAVLGRGGLSCNHNRVSKAVYRGEEGEGWAVLFYSRDTSPRVQVQSW